MAFWAALGLAVGLAGSAVGATLVGTKGPDVIKGTAGPDRIFGRGGDDRLLGRGGPDLIRGGRGSDLLAGARGRDTLRGGKGGDRLRGGPGRNLLVGGRGRNEYAMRDGVQLAAPGRDTIRARNGRADEINCGKGGGTAHVDDLEDGVYDCERVLGPDGEEIGEHVAPDDPGEGGG